VDFPLGNSLRDLTAYALQQSKTVYPTSEVLGSGFFCVPCPSRTFVTENLYGDRTKPFGSTQSKTPHILRPPIVLAGIAMAFLLRKTADLLMADIFG